MAESGNALGAPIDVGKPRVSRCPRPTTQGIRTACRSTSGRGARARRARLLTQDDFNHFVQDWLGSPGWWPANAVPDTLRAGFVQAITHARTAQKPMEVLWVCTHDPDFHVYFCEGPRQVTVLIFSPPPRQHTNLLLNHRESIWVVKLRDQFDNQYPNLGTAIPAPQVVATVQNGPAAGQHIIQQHLFYAD